MNKEQVNLIIKLLNEAGYNDAATMIAKKEENTDWRNELETNKSGTTKATYNNYKLIWENAPEFKNWTLRLNEFTHRIELNDKPIDNTAWPYIRNNFETAGGVRNKDVTKDFVYVYSNENKYNPVIDYLNGLEWDKKPRIETMFIDWFKVEDCDVIRKMSKKWMISAVKRIFEPGCPIEGMIILNGKQGMGKSTFVSRLSKGFVLDASFDVKDEKKCAENCSNAWIVNFDELKGFIKADPESAKAFLTRNVDTCRLAYREEVEDYPRHCVFIGSTNDSSILKDYTGKIERRYWVMKSNLEDKKFIYENFTSYIADQLWAEAVYEYKQNPNYNISISDFTEEEEEIMYGIQREFKTYADDDLVDSINEILNYDYVLNPDGTFKGQNDFINQITNKENYSGNKKINCIPFSYLNRAISTLYHTNRPNKWIAAALEDEWIEIQRVQYANTKLHGLVRKSTYNVPNRIKSMFEVG